MKTLHDAAGCAMHFELLVRTLGRMAMWWCWSPPRSIVAVVIAASRGLRMFTSRIPEERQALESLVFLVPEVTCLLVNCCGELPSSNRKSTGQRDLFGPFASNPGTVDGVDRKFT